MHLLVKHVEDVTYGTRKLQPLLLLGREVHVFSIHDVNGSKGNEARRHIYRLGVGVHQYYIYSTPPSIHSLKRMKLSFQSNDLACGLGKAHFITSAIL